MIKKFLLSLLTLSSFSIVSAVPPVSALYQQEISVKEVEKEVNVLYSLIEEWEKVDLHFHPETATFQGKKEGLTEWTSFSENSLEKELDFVLDFRNRVEALSEKKLPKKEKLNLLLLKEEIEKKVKFFEFNEKYLALSPLWGIHHQIPEILQLMPKETLEDRSVIFLRMQKIPKLLEEVTLLLEEGLELGITHPQESLNSLPSQIRSFISVSVEYSPFFSSFYSLDDTIAEEKALKEEVKTYIEEVIFPLYESLALFTEKKYIPGSVKMGFQNLPNGQAWYEYIVKKETSTHLSPEEVHQLGLKEIARVTLEMEKVLKEIGFEGSLSDFFQFLKTENFSFKSEEHLLQEYHNLIRTVEERLPLLFNEMPKTPLVIKKVPSLMAKNMPLAFYQLGSYKNGLPGIFYINTSSLEDSFTWQAASLFLHEAIPGHHYQCSLNDEDESLSSFRTALFHRPFIEGWALYCESLGKELGLYDDPYTYFGSLMLEMLRSTRLVVDTGLHAFSWDKEKAIQFMLEKTGLPLSDVSMEVNRYLAVPGQALSYKVGFLKIAALRKKGEEALKERFDIKKFHQKLLKEGPLPLDLLEEEIDHWIGESLYPSI